MRAQSILVVEDERVIARDLQAMLQRLGYEVPAIAGAGADAVVQAVTLHPDLVLMDIRLQGAMDGIDAAERIYAQLDIPVVYLTAFADDLTRQRARRTAPYGYLVKPFDERTVQATIEMALERHARDRRARQHEQWLATTLASIGEAIVTTDADGHITFVNPAAEQILRCGRAAAIGAPIADVVMLLDAHTRARIEHPVSAALQSHAPAHLPEGTLLIARDGAEVAIAGSVAPISAADGSALGAVLIFQEHAERRRAAAAQRAHAQHADDDRQLERLRVLAAGLAHDFNNLLTVMLGNAELARYELPSRSPAHDLLDQVVGSANRAADLTRQLLAYASDTLLLIRPLDLNDLVRQAVASLSGPALRHVTIRTLLAPDLPAVDVDAAQIHQVVRSVLVNAVEAIGEADGTITIATELRRLTSADLARAVVGADRPAGWYVALEIADTGAGMDEATLARIFEPFFSTKFTGRGLGLPAALGAIRQHQGALMVQSVVGHGATFTLLFPCVPASISS
jgi:PAS domain S-box-containing protein